MGEGPGVREKYPPAFTSPSPYPQSLSQREKGFNAVQHHMNGRNGGHVIALLKVLEWELYLRRFDIMIYLLFLTPP